MEGNPEFIETQKQLIRASEVESSLASFQVFFRFNANMLPYSFFRKINTIFKNNFMKQKFIRHIEPYLADLEEKKEEIREAFINNCMQNHLKARSTEFMFKVTFDPYLSDTTDVSCRFGKWLQEEGSKEDCLFVYIFGNLDKDKKCFLEHFHESYLTDVVKNSNVFVEHIEGDPTNDKNVVSTIPKGLAEALVRSLAIVRKEEPQKEPEEPIEMDEIRLVAEPVIKKQMSLGKTPNKT
jgi:hypothetical protein